MDADNIRDAIQRFRFGASPSNTDSSSHATIGDIKKLIDEIARLAESIADNVE